MSALPQPNPRQRPMTLGDLDAVAAIESRAYSHPWSHGNFVDSLVAGYFADVLDDPAHGPIGYFVAMAGVDELHLLNITVAPDWQRRGFGSLLLDTVRLLAVRAGHASLWLEVRESNLRALALYGRRGFVHVGTRRDYYPAAPQRENAVVMRLALAPAGPAHG
ncbi:MAG: ribosomal protein S18-alanine N-acetyltransferase [Rubrivivax sp.]